jgi:dTDP-glucose pyrophosphorylase
MAGRGSRFALAGFEDPKPLIPIHGVPMIRWVIRNLTPETNHRFIFIAQAEHIKTYDLNEKLTNWAPGSVVISVDGITSGAAATVLIAKDLINNNSPLLIANSDQWVETDIQEYLNFVNDENSDGSIMTMEAHDPKWSYAQLAEDGTVVRVVEKEVISNHATVGIYGFKHGSDFVKFAGKMIEENFTVNGEHYVAPVYNWMISEGKRVVTHLIGSEANGMFGLGIPEDMRIFETNPVSKNVWKK